MPYKIVKSGKLYKVINERTGRVLGEHPSWADAVKQLAVLKAIMRKER